MGKASKQRKRSRASNLLLPQRRSALPPGLMLEGLEPSHHRLYAPMGEKLLIETNDDIIIQAADEAFGRFHHLVTDSREPLVLRLFVHDIAQERSRPIYRTQGHLYYITAGSGSTAVADLERGAGFGFVTQDVANDRAFVRYVFLEGMALAMLAVSRKLIPIHAACVVKEGKSIILVGKPGKGKSTLAFACARRGYKVLAEESLYIKRGGRAMRLWGLPWKIRLPLDTVRFFPELANERPKLQINGQWKLEVESEQYYPSSTTTQAPPGSVIFLEREDREALIRIERVGEDEVLETLQVVWPWHLGWGRDMDRRLHYLVMQGAHRLWMNQSLEDAVDALDELLASNRRRSS